LKERGRKKRNQGKKGKKMNENEKKISSNFYLISVEKKDLVADFGTFLK
jgi:hypothetical protein